MVSDQLLKEEGESTAYGVATYLKLGLNSHKLLSDFSQETFIIITHIKVKEQQVFGVAEDDTYNSSDDDELKRIEDDCFTELKTDIASSFPELKSVYSAMPVTVYREIAQHLPVNSQQLLEVDQMTQIRVQKYGKILLEVCQRFYDKKMAYLKDKLIAENLAREDALEATTSPAGDAPSGWIGKKS